MPGNEGRGVAVKRGIVVGLNVLAGMGIVIASCAGCSDNKSNTGASSTPPPAAAPPQVIVDGKNLNVSGPVTCTPAGNNINIGIGDPANGIGAVVSTDNPPIVHAVGLGNVDGITLGFADAAPPDQGGNAGAAASGNSLQIRGTAVGPDTSNPQQPKQITKPFEMDLTCP